ncbi:TPA: hypothetical protein R8E83_003574 [Escherichia coli]|nr:hypothetical protein [Escherichia coli]
MLTDEQQAARAAAIEAGLNPGTLNNAQNGWERPTGADIRILLNILGLSVTAAAAIVDADRVTASRWLSGARKISYPYWAILVSVAGLGNLWE